MKKLLALLLTLCLCFGLLAACGAPAEETPTEPAPTVPTAPTEPPMQTSDPAADDTLNILLIGHSFCYYFTDELYGMLTAAGIRPGFATSMTPAVCWRPITSAGKRIPPTIPNL